MVRALSLLALMGAMPVAAGQFALPDGCAAVASVQQRDCVVAHYYRCDADPAGLLHRADISETGLTFTAQTDAEGRWLRSHDIHDGAGGGTVNTLGAERDAASFSALLADGVDTFDFWTRSDTGEQTRFAGYDRLTGVQVEIDGVTLLETEFRMEVFDADGGFLWRSEGQEYIQPDWRAFLSGQRRVTLPDDSFDADGTPMAFARPGEDGFLSDTPIFGCDLNMATLMPTADGGA